MTITHYASDDLVIAVQVAFDPGAEISALTGGAVEAKVQNSQGSLTSASSCTITSPDTVRVGFADGSLSAGFYKLQVRATVDGVTQTVAEDSIDVRASL